MDTFFLLLFFQNKQGKGAASKSQSLFLAPCPPLFHSLSTKGNPTRLTLLSLAGEHCWVGSRANPPVNRQIQAQLSEHTGGSVLLGQACIILSHG
eukprot:scaffold258918_cov15-Tisochrysis_lutea.AAC.1